MDSGPLFRRLWGEALDRYRRTQRGPSAGEALRVLWDGGRLAQVRFPEQDFLDFTDGSVARFPGSGEGLSFVQPDPLAPPLELLARRRAVVVTRRKPTEALRRFVERQFGSAVTPAAISDSASERLSRPEPA